VAGAASGRVDHVVGSDDECHVGAGKLRVDLVHLLQLPVGHVRLGEQDVHVARHAAGDRVDGVADLHPARFEQRGQVPYLVLGLGCSQTIAGHNHDLAGVRELDGGIVGGNGTHLGTAGYRGGGGRVVTGAEATDHDVDDRPVHGVG